MIGKMKRPEALMAKKKKPEAEAISIEVGSPEDVLEEDSELEMESAPAPRGLEKISDEELIAEMKKRKLSLEDAPDTGLEESGDEDIFA